MGKINKTEDFYIMHVMLVMSSIIIFFFLLTSCVNQISNETIKAEKAQINSLVLKIEKTKWEGRWTLGKQSQTNYKSILKIIKIDDIKFEFTLDASFRSTLINENGEKISNYHMGSLEGVAFFSSNSEANYIFNKFPHYKMVFKLKENKIFIQEINLITGQDFGESPNAGVNVRYFGIYSKIAV